MAMKLSSNNKPVMRYLVYQGWHDITRPGKPFHKTGLGDKVILPTLGNMQDL